MKTKHKVGIGVVIAAMLVALAGWYLHRQPIQVLQPAGPVATKERNLIVFCAALSLAIVLPVFGLLGYFAYKYRAGNKKAKYTPELGGSKGAEFIWWLVPSVLILLISVVTWQSSYALDPYKPIASSKSALQVQVVALDWKWLFIYPQYGIASVNEVAMPVNRPVDFQLTSDAVMTSLWIPQLGGQMYAMPGMTTQLNLEAAKTGNYHGEAANISGKGFAGMTFTAKALDSQHFSDWLSHAHSSHTKLDDTGYAFLAKPTENNQVQYYSSVSGNLFNDINMKYMMPMGSSSSSSMKDMQGMNGMMR